MENKEKEFTSLTDLVDEGMRDWFTLNLGLILTTKQDDSSKRRAFIFVDVIESHGTIFLDDVIGGHLNTNADGVIKGMTIENDMNMMMLVGLYRSFLTGECKVGGNVTYGSTMNNFHFDAHGRVMVLLMEANNWVKGA